MPISWSSFDCILGYTTYNTEIHHGKANENIMPHFTKSIRLKGSVQFTIILHLKRLFILSWLDGTESSLMTCTWQFGSPSDLRVESPLVTTYGVEEAWYFTNAIAASSLQNSSNTITPSSNVMWSILGKVDSKSMWVLSRSLNLVTFLDKSI